MAMKRFFFLFVVIQCFCLPLSWAQTDPPLRIELEMAKDASDYNYAMAGDNGVFVFYEGNAINVDSSSMIFMHYDTNLRKTYNFSVKLPSSLKFIASTLSDSSLFLLFQQEISKKHARRSVVVRIDFPEHVFSSCTIDALDDPDVYALKAVDNHLFILASNDKKESLYFYNCISGELNQFKADTTIYEIEFCEPDTFNRQLWVGAVLQYSSKSSVLAMYNIDYDGNVISVQPFPVYGGYYYNSARLSVIDSTRAMVIGTYNNENDRYSGNMHTGVYTIKIEDSEFGVPNFFSYTKLHYQDSTAKNKHNSNLNFQLLVGEITTNGSQYAFVTEVFYPEYNTNNYSSYDPFYGGYYSTPSTSTFAGYRLVNAYVTTFDEEGQLLWDHYLPFQNILTYRLAQRVSVFFTPENYALLYYPYNFTLTSMLVEDNHVIENLSSMDLETLLRHDEVDYSRNPKIQKWYGTNFLVSGSQYIKNTSKTAKSKRYVFFLNKLAYR